MKENNILKQLGLTEKEIQTYYGLLSLGSATMTELSKFCSIKRPTAYVTVDSLIRLGLVFVGKSKNRKTYFPAHPSKLHDLVNEYERGVNNIMPNLLEIYNQAAQKPKVSVIEGKRGLQLLYRELYESIKNSEESLWFTDLNNLYKNFPDAVNMFKHFIQKYPHARIRELIIENSSGKIWDSESKILRGKNHLLRYLPAKFKLGRTDSVIVGNKLIIFSFESDMFATIIESQQIAATHKAMYEWLWSIAK